MYKIALILLFVVIFSGCTTEQGNVIKTINYSDSHLAEFQDTLAEDETKITDPCNQAECKDTIMDCGSGIVVTCKNYCANGECTKCKPTCDEIRLDEIVDSQSEETETQEIQTEGSETQEPQDICSDVICMDSTEICPDSSEASCENTCNQDTGSCSECTPDCSDNQPCVEDWSCTDWSECSNGQQIMSCSDINNCGTETNKPDETKECEQQLFGNDEDIIINEIMYNPSTSQCNDFDCEWLELFNKGDMHVNLTGWMLDEHILEDIIINGNEYIIITRELIDNDDVNEESFESYWGDNSGLWKDSDIESYNVYDHTFSLKNTGDTIVLESPTGYLESITYSKSQGADGNNKTLERNSQNIWTESSVNGGTPGFTNNI